MECIGSSFTGKNFDNDTVMGKFIEQVELSVFAATKIATDCGVGSNLVRSERYAPCTKAKVFKL